MSSLRSTASAMLAAALLLAVLCPRAVPADEPAKRPLVIAHYMAWFEANPGNRQWGWHWKMNAFDPEQTIDGKRSIASHYYPLIGPYDSGDPAVIEYHLLLMKLAGIDGFVVDWYGLSDFLDYPAIHRNTRLLVDAAAKAGLRVAICYEDQTIPRLVAAQRLAAGESVSYARHELQWMRENWFAKTAYLKLHDRPVLLSFGADGMSDDEWTQVLRGPEKLPLYLSEHRRRSVAAGSFDWPQPQIGLAAQDRYYQSVKPGETFVPVAFPRFHDIYKEGKAQEGYPQIPDEGGRTFMTTLERAWKSGAPLVQIATWNDWGEGTQIEPSREFAYRDLEAMQRQRRAADPGFAPSPKDLRLPYRLWVLRKLQSTKPSLTQDLDAIARLIASGHLSEATAALQRAETFSKKSG